MAPFIGEIGVTLKLIKSNTLVILVVIPVDILSMAFPDESVVAIEKELVYAVVLGFIKPSIWILKGVPVAV